MGRDASVSSDAAGFDGFQPLKENPGHHHSPLARSVGHRTARGRQLLARPAAKIAFIRFHAPLHEMRLAPSRAEEFT
jgi:hypothetical protein